MASFGQVRSGYFGARPKITFSSIKRISMPVSILLYCAAFNWSYIKWIAPVWYYLGFTYRSPDPILLTSGYVLAVLLCALSPIRIRRPSQVIYWLLYFSVYIPGLFVPVFIQLDPSLTLLLLQLSLTGGMLVIALSYRVRLIQIPSFPLESRLFWAIFSMLFVVCNIILLIVFRGSLHFASLKEVYATRFGALQVAEQNAGISYISSILGSVINPFLIAYGLSTKKRKFALLGTAAQVLVYSTAAMKAVLLSPAIILIFYYTMKRDRGGWAPKMALIFTGAFFVLTILVIGHQEGLAFNVASAVLLRSFAIPGCAIGQYLYFFEKFPHTFLSTVGGISLIIHNPYAMSTGKEIGNFYVGKGANGYPNANASFFASDAIAGFGLPGIPVLSLLCALVFSVLDSCARKYPLAFSTSALTMCAISLTNGSLFTTFLSGGLLAFMLLFLFMPRHLLTSSPH